jgi:hypothetical protein
MRYSGEIAENPLPSPPPPLPQTEHTNRRTPLPTCERADERLREGCGERRGEALRRHGGEHACQGRGEGGQDVNGEVAGERVCRGAGRAAHLRSGPGGGGGGAGKGPPQTTTTTKRGPAPAWNGTRQSTSSTTGRRTSVALSLFRSSGMISAWSVLIRMLAVASTPVSCSCFAASLGGSGGGGIGGTAGYTSPSAPCTKPPGGGSGAGDGSGGAAAGSKASHCGAALWQVKPARRRIDTRACSTGVPRGVTQGTQTPTVLSPSHHAGPLAPAGCALS